MKAFELLRQRSVPELVRAACILALVGLGLMAFAVISKRALPVILGMSLGHALGGAAVVCYVLAVVFDAANRADETSQKPEATRSDEEPE